MMTMEEEIQKWLEVSYMLCAISTKKQMKNQSIMDVHILLTMLKNNHKKELIEFLEGD